MTATDPLATLSAAAEKFREIAYSPDAEVASVTAASVSYAHARDHFEACIAASFPGLAEHSRRLAMMWLTDPEGRSVSDCASALAEVVATEEKYEPDARPVCPVCGERRARWPELDVCSLCVGKSAPDAREYGAAEAVDGPDVLDGQWDDGYPRA